MLNHFLLKLYFVAYENNLQKTKISLAISNLIQLLKKEFDFSFISAEILFINSKFLLFITVFFNY